MGNLYRDRQKIRKAEFVNEVIKYRKLGMSYPAIAERMNCGVNSVRKAIKTYTEEIPKETVNEVRQLELERLDAMLIKNIGNAMQGSTQAVNAVIRIMDHRAKLLGLYNPEVDDGMAAAGAELESFMQAVRTMAQNMESDTDG